MRKLSSFPLLLVGVLLTGSSLAGGAGGKITERGAIRFEDGQYFVVQNSQPGKISSKIIEGEEEVLRKAMIKTNEIEKVWEDEAAGGLFNPLTLLLEIYPDGKIFLVSFE
jgi:hypothetical protein